MTPCKLCRHELRPQLDKRLNRGETSRAVIDFARQNGLAVSKPTVLAHRKHIIDPKTAFVMARRNEPIKRVTHTEFLESVVDAGAARVEQSPEDVTIDQGIRAAQVLGTKKDNPADAINNLVLILMGKSGRPLLPEGDETPLLTGDDE